MKSHNKKMSLAVLAFGLLLPAAAEAETLTFRQYRVTVPGTIHDMVVADFNKDGYPDIAVIDYPNKLIRTFMGSATYAYPQAFTKANSKLGKVFVGAADFNGDGVPDLAVDMPSTKTYFAVFPGKTDGSLADPVYVGTGKTQPGFDQAAVLDFNADGKPDVVGFQQYGGSLLSFLNLGNAKFKTRKLQDKCDYDSIVTGNFDSDKYNDFVLGELYPKDIIYYFKSKKDGTFMPAKKTTHSALGTCLVAGDLNGDKKLDLVGDGNYWNDAWSMIGNGSGLFSKKKMLSANASLGGGGVLAKLGADAKLDLATGETGGVALFSGNGTGTFASQGRMAQHLRFDRELGTLASGDVNGDGRPDLMCVQWDTGIRGADESDDMSNFIFFLNGQTPNTLTISNLVTTKLTFAGSLILYAGSVQFQSTSGDLKFINMTEVTDNAYMHFYVTLDFPSPLKDYTYHCFATGSYFHKPGQTSGTASWDVSIATTIVTNATPTVTLKNFYLLDYNLVQSNGLLTTTPRPGRSLRTAQAAPGLGKVLHSGRDGIAALVGVEIK